MSNKEKALHQLETIDHQLEALISFLENENSQHFTYVEQATDWSCLQILKHLEMAETLSINYLKYKLKEGKSFPKAGLKQVYASWIMKKAYKSKKKFVAPESQGLVPAKEGLDYDEIIISYRNHRAKQKQFLTGLEEKYYGYAMYKHPFFGRLTLSQMLTFYEGHVERHEKQIRRTLESAKRSV